MQFYKVLINMNGDRLFTMNINKHGFIKAIYSVLLCICLTGCALGHGSEEDKIPEKSQPCQGGLTALEQEGDGPLCYPSRLFNERAAHLIGHQAVVGHSPSPGLIGVKAVCAAQIAGAGGGLQENTQGRHGGVLPCFVKFLSSGRGPRSAPDRSSGPARRCTPGRRSPYSGSSASAERPPPGQSGSPDGWST